MDLGTIQIDNLDQECVAAEHILKLVREHIKTNAEAEAAIDKLKPFFKKWSAYDNDQPKGTPPKLIQRGTDKE